MLSTRNMNIDCTDSPPKKRLKQTSIMESLSKAGFAKFGTSSENPKDHCTVDIEPDENPSRQDCSPDMFSDNAEALVHFSGVAILEGTNTVLEENICVETKITESASLIQSWRGMPIQNMSNLFHDHSELIEVEPGAFHKILFQIPILLDQVPKPKPEMFEDYWDSFHVKMPCSPSNIYPVKEEGKSILKQRWNLTKEAYEKPIKDTIELEKAILSYNSRYDQIWNFQGLHRLITKILSYSDRERFFHKTLPGIIRLALSISEKVTHPPILLVKQKPQSLSLSQAQIASLLANAFLCTFPRRNTQKKQSEFASYPDINFVRLFENKSKTKWIDEKLKCLFHYFDRVIDHEPTGVVTFTRQVLTEADYPNWEKIDGKFTGFHVSSEGMIEKEGTGLLQIDFANRFIGGGVLGWGCVQEEIRFIICPELIVARLFTEEMDNNEVLSITGCEQYCRHSGYSNTFRFEGDFVDLTPRDAYGRKLCKVVAMDALKFRRPEVQYQRKFIQRELNKAYVGFRSTKFNCKLAAVATGNWGCGAYRGDPRLKCLLQLMAAAQANRDVVYFTFGDERLRDDLYNMYSTLIEKRVTVGHLYQILCQYGDQFGESPSPSIDLYGYIYAILDSYDSENEIECESHSAESNTSVHSKDCQSNVEDSSSHSTSLLTET